MIELKRLLQFTPDEAILMMANKEMNTHLRPEIADVGEVEAIAGLRTRVVIRTTDKKPEMIQNPYHGQSVLEYNRYDLTSTFDVILSNLKLPSTVETLLNQVAEATGIVFDKGDFDNEVIETEEYWLRAKSTSKRWVGGVKVILEADTAGTHISQYLPVTGHDGLVVSPKHFVWDIFTNNILDGLDLEKPGIGIYLRNTDHDGLVKDERLDISHYLQVTDHEGLVKDARPSIDVYLPVADHEGLKYIRRMTLTSNPNGGYVFNVPDDFEF